MEVKKQKLPDYSDSALKEILTAIKALSVKKPEEYSEETIKVLNGVGVALIYIEHFPGTGVSGAVRWIGETPVIQLSLYYPWADVFLVQFVSRAGTSLASW